MEIYVQSRGLEKDYNWVAREENHSEEIHITVPDIIAKATDLIDAQDFSVVLLRSRNALLLLVTGLETQRQDIQSRNIINSIAWVGRNENEFLLRRIAALALMNQLEQRINDAVKSSNNLVGFDVDWKAIEQLIAVDITQNELLQKEEEKAQIARISEARKQELAEKLIKYRLPDGEGALVIVTGIKSKEALEAAVVWRGLSSDTKIQQSWQPIIKEVNNQPNEDASTSENIFCDIIKSVFGTRI